MRETVQIIKLACALRALNLEHHNADLAIGGLADAIEAAASSLGGRVQDMELVLDHITSAPPEEQRLPAFSNETDAMLVDRALARYAMQRPTDRPPF
jgi:hypothetical protein